MKNQRACDHLDNAELWENDQLGCSEKTAKLSSFTVADLQKSIQLQAISLRIQKDLLEDLKLIAKHHGIGYQPLMKQILKRFVDAEKKHFGHKLYVLSDHDEVA